MIIEQAAHKFIQHMEYLNYSDRSIKLYEYYLNRFQEFFSNCDLKEITPLKLYEYQRYLFRLKFKASTQSTNLTVVKMLFRFLIRQQLIKSDPSNCIELPKIDKHLPKHILTIKQIEDMIKATDQFGQLAQRNRLIIELFYATGMRVAELSNLTINSVMDHLGLVRILGKGNKERIIPISRRAVKLINQYVSNYRPILLAKSKNQKANFNRLILSYRGNKMNNDTLAFVVRETARLAGIKSKVTPHTIRHTLATHLLQAGMDIRYIQEILGHQDLRTTQIYTQVQNKDLIKMVEMYHPLC